MTRLQIKYFLTAAKCLNFTEAAKQLYISQPTLSQQISAMEKELNMQLFVRRKGKIYLTPAAIILMQDLPQYEDLYVDIIERAKLANEGKTGLLTLGIVEGQCFPEHLLKTFFEFRKDYPQIGVNVCCCSFGDLQRKLEEDEVDIIYTPDFLIDKNPVYMYELVAEDYAVAVVSKYHPVAKQNITSLSQLKDETFLFLQERECEIVNELMRKDCERAGFIPNVKYVPGLNENISYAELGFGVAFTNQDTFGCHNPNLVVLRNLKIAERKFVFGWKKKNVNPSIALFSNYVMEKIKKD